MIRVVVLFLVLSVSACTQKSTKELVMHRELAETKHESGWFEAVSTEGSFSILIPLPFNDYTITVVDSNIGEMKTFGIGSRSTEGCVFSINEMRKTERMNEIDLQSLVDDFEKKGSLVTEVRSTSYQLYPSVFFRAERSNGGAFVQYVNTPSSLITVILEYPESMYEEMDSLKETFFTSLKVGALESNI